MPDDDHPEPERVLMSIDITQRGTITCWTASRPDGDLIEDWRLKGQFTAAVQSHTWDLDVQSYLAVRDILRYLTEADWEPDTPI